jgi:hypothetical protein
MQIITRKKSTDFKGETKWKRTVEGRTGISNRHQSNPAKAE